MAKKNKEKIDLLKELICELEILENAQRKAYTKLGIIQAKSKLTNKLFDLMEEEDE